MLIKTYRRNVDEYEFCYKNNYIDFFATIKKILNIKNPVVLKDGTCIMDNGFYIVEILPKHEKYGMRVYLKEQKKNNRILF